MRFSLFIFAVLIFSALPTTNAAAYNPSINVPALPYQVYMADSDITTQAEYLGELVGDPHMYEFSVGADTKLTLTLLQRAEDALIPLSLIAVRQNNQNAGVVEVGRLTTKDITWSEVVDSGLGLSLVSSQSFEAMLTPGIYRVEVSTADNYGKYMLKIGEAEANPGYFSTLADVRMIQKFFGASIFSLLASSYVYYPLGSIVMVWLLYVTWRNRERLSKKSHG